MRVLVFGSTGMLGHKVMQMLPARYSVFGTVRGPVSSVACADVLAPDRLIGNVDVGDLDEVAHVVSQIRPQFVINCVGVIKQLEAGSNPRIAIGINSLFPHQLADICRTHDARLIHISSDCVFSGNRGMYKETDVADAIDLYGRTKLLGEVSESHCLTLRTSIIGRELTSANGLIEWFLQRGQNKVHGFRRAIYTGLTTIEFVRVLQRVMDAPGVLNGIYQVSSEPITKYDLLHLARRAFGVFTEIVPTDVPVIDRSLDSARFRQELGYAPPSWPCMIEEMAKDKTDYRRNRSFGRQEMS